jgi:hypothetical protein
MSTSEYTLNSLRSLRNYGLYVIGNTLDPVFDRGWIQTKPNILIKGGSCYIDYSHAFNVSDLIYLNQTFSELGSGTTFYMQPSEYYDQEKNILLNLGGTCTVNQFLNDDKIIVANILSGFTGASGYVYFTKENFVGLPQFTFQQTKSFTGYFLVNSLPKLSKTTIQSMGVLGNALGYEEYISLSSGVCENSERIQVQGTVTLKDFQEVLYFTSGGTSQDMGNTLTNVSLYLRGDPSIISAPRESSVTGIYTVVDSNSNGLLNCYENQSLNQFILRKEKLASNFIANYFNCKNCPDLVYGSQNTMEFGEVGFNFNNLLLLYIVDGATATLTNSLTASFVVNSTGSIRVASSPTKILKIDLSHPSLIDYDLAIYTNANKTTVLDATNFSKYGRLGYNNSYAIIKNYQPNTTLYCTLQGPSTIFFTLLV